MYIPSNELTFDEDDIEVLVDELMAFKELSFQSRANRDAVAKAAKQRGMTVRKSSISNQSIDPRYTAEGRHLPDKGLGNDRIYTNLYILESL